jgi:hypothetical protein
MEMIIRNHSKAHSNYTWRHEISSGNFAEAKTGVDTSDDAAD